MEQTVTHDDHHGDNEDNNEATDRQNDNDTTHNRERASELDQLLVYSVSS